VTAMQQFHEQVVQISAGPLSLAGSLTIPAQTRAVVLFAHGSGSGRHSPRNRFVARAFNEAGLATLLMDLLTEAEDLEDQVMALLRFDIDLLATRVNLATDWLRQQPQFKDARIGYLGASTGAAAALVAAARRADVDAIVSRGGRPDLAGEALAKVRAPVLLLVGGLDTYVIELNRQAMELLPAEKKLVLVPGATHLFVERGTLPEVARLAAEWFARYLLPTP